MAYRGGIDFLNTKSGKFRWFSDDIKSPWASGDAKNWLTNGGRELPELKACARPFTLLGDEWKVQNGIEIICDNHSSAKIMGEDLMWVVLGMEEKNNASEENNAGEENNVTKEATYLVLVITASEQPLRTKEPKRVVCERVGVGMVKDRWMNLESPAQDVVIR